MEFLIIWVVCGLLALVVANGKGRSGCGWGLLGFLFGPLGLLAAVGMPKVDKAAPVAQDLRPCPMCAEPIQKAAVKCRFCHSDVSPAVANEIVRPCPLCRALIPKSAERCTNCHSKVTPVR